MYYSALRCRDCGNVLEDEMPVLRDFLCRQCWIDNNRIQWHKLIKIQRYNRTKALLFTALIFLLVVVCLTLLQETPRKLGDSVVPDSVEQMDFLQARGYICHREYREYLCRSNT